jgi:hypothetical protein
MLASTNDMPNVIRKILSERIAVCDDNENIAIKPL